MESILDRVSLARLKIYFSCSFPQKDENNFFLSATLP